jgi:hypothetical protein
MNSEKPDSGKLHPVRLVFDDAPDEVILPEELRGKRLAVIFRMLDEGATESFHVPLVSPAQPVEENLLP